MVRCAEANPASEVRKDTTYSEVQAPEHYMMVDVHHEVGREAGEAGYMRFTTSCGTLVKVAVEYSRPVLLRGAGFADSSEEARLALAAFQRLLAPGQTVDPSALVQYDAGLMHPYEDVFVDALGNGVHFSKRTCQFYCVPRTGRLLCEFSFAYALRPGFLNSNYTDVPPTAIAFGVKTFRRS